MANKKNFIDPVSCKIPKSPDEKIVLPEEDYSSTDSMTWRIFRIMAEFVSGFQFIAKYKKTVTVFGSARLPEGSKYYLDAVEITKRLGKSGFNTVTGGGPGIMEAANRGAFESSANSIGLNIQLPFEQRINKYVKKGIGFHYFFTRKVILSAAGQAYIFFPGGYGTLDEFFEIITLIQTQKMEKIPVILFGSEFWKPLSDFIDNIVYDKFKCIDKEDSQIYRIVDSVEEAVSLVKKSKDRRSF